MKTRDLAAIGVVIGAAVLPVLSWAGTAAPPAGFGSHASSGASATGTSGVSGQHPAADRYGDHSTDFTDTIGGIDSQGDGIRDDVRKYIDDQYPDPVQRAAMRLYAAAQRDFMMHGDTRAGAIEGFTRVFRSLECVRKLMGQPGVNQSKIIAAMMSNTRQRFAANGHAMANASGHIYMQSQGDPCAQ
ncbi:hypothetical protein G3O00_03520 [Burkholderia sp. Ac-20384]|uniref:hypothetical protein n=1 Tax=Burkholderia sp. Ac-20384 TaxID=2703902 RepID=UPI00197F57F9|nr:hypothetical protein [Burkholderia sp. Ac-20384]MBN3822687.1 hypothetical protein [Burkholderia sp. Ac-20384]